MLQHDSSNKTKYYIVRHKKIEEFQKRIDRSLRIRKEFTSNFVYHKDMLNNS